MTNIIVEAQEKFPNVPPEFQLEIYQLFLLLIGADIQTGELVLPYQEHVPRYNLFCLLRWAIGMLEFDELDAKNERIKELVSEILSLQILSKDQLDMLVRGLYCDIDPGSIA